jgi:hypothetical protein
MTSPQLEFEHEVRNAAAGVELEVRRIRMAMERLETHLQRMDKACADCKKIEASEQQLIDKI